MRVWECKIMIYISKIKNHDKLKSQVKEEIFIDYTENYNQYLIFLSVKNKIIKITSLRFLENKKEAVRSISKIYIKKIFKQEKYNSYQQEKDNSHKNINSDNLD